MNGQTPIDLRRAIPSRSILEPRRHYRDYKQNLRNDFSRRCGYCDANDQYFGGVTGAHIDHFAPKSVFRVLEHVYDNLVYSCPFCNRAKSNKWIGTDATIPNDGVRGFVDPCGPELDIHVARDEFGGIIPSTELGEFILKNLKLRLLRHRTIWQAQRLEDLLKRLLDLRRRLDRQDALYLQLIDAIADVVQEYLQYREIAYEI